MHANELPLQHLLSYLDGSTTKPKAFSGSTGKALVNCEKLPVVTFEKIDVTLPKVKLKDLRTDQKYLWEMCEAISKSECLLALPKKTLGILNHSRWLTTANRLLRLYVASEDPSMNLKYLVTYVMIWDES